MCHDLLTAQVVPLKTISGHVPDSYGRFDAAVLWLTFESWHTSSSSMIAVRKFKMMSIKNTTTCMVNTPHASRNDE